MSLKDAIGKDTYIIDDACYTDNDLQAMSTDDLEKLKMRIANKISRLAALIQEKRIEYNSGGEGATKEWYARQKFVLTINENALPYINGLLKQRRRSERNIGDAFMDHAKRILPPKDFYAIFLRAQKTMQTGGE